MRWSVVSFMLLGLGLALGKIEATEQPPPRPDVTLADFDGETYGGWTAVGEAFGEGPARGALPGQMPVGGFKGRGLVNSFRGGDRSVGKLTSSPFRIDRRYVAFLIGGGKDPVKTCMNLRVGDTITRTATGPNDRPGGSESLEPDYWDVSEFLGRTAVVEIVDEATGGWGHINVDHVVLTDELPSRPSLNVSRELAITGRYIHIPIKNGSAKRRVTARIVGGPARSFDVELADAAPDWWAFMDVSEYRGRTVVLTADKLPAESKALSNVDSSDAIKDSEDLYRERLRPQFHFSPRRGWTNDPNGLVYYQGEYHLFFQHNPYGWSWGNMHWGHAVSPDLVHWTELPIALYPDDHGTMFSGSAVVDWENTAGLQSGEEKPLICVFTAAGKPFTQGIAYSNDRGRTWAKYAGNPVLPHIVGENRDPKVIRYAPEKKWIMALYLDKNDFGLFSSKDLKNWEKLSGVTIPGTTECPEFFEIPLDGDKSNTRWIFYGGNGRHLIGAFDGRTFKPESGPHALQHGDSWYASQTFTDVPPADGRRILMPWGTTASPGMPFNQMIGIPVELTLHATEDGPRLRANPVKELESLRVKRRSISPGPLKSGVVSTASEGAELLDVLAELALGDARKLTLDVRGVPIVYDVKKHEIACGQRKAPLKPMDGKIRLRVLVDRTTIDLFGGDGRLYMAMGARFPEGARTVSIAADGGDARVESLTVHELESAWRSIR